MTSSWFYYYISGTESNPEPPPFVDADIAAKDKKAPPLVLLSVKNRVDECHESTLNFAETP